MREIVVDRGGTRRFKSNLVVRYLVDTHSQKGVLGLLADTSRLFSKEDMKEFYQMLGYSVEGYLELFPEDEERLTESD